MLRFKRRAPLREHSVVLMPHQSRLARLFRLGLIVCLILAAPMGAWIGWQAALRSQAPAVLERDQLLIREQNLIAELEAARQATKRIEVDLLVEREALSQGRQVIQQLEQQLFRFQQDLAQYQGALEPGAMMPGVRFQSFELQATESNEVFRYKVMVSRVGDESDTVEGRLILAVSGQLDGQPVTLSMSELSPANAEGVELNFRYFQVVPASGQASEFTLPEGFQPEKIELRAVQNDDILAEQSFDWMVTGA
ncbi:MAG: hypothetical protein CVV07_13610 [Gammaproteobacteria bacterium HGW-Gammaproteobacteria-11]|nr:MAG: hypothetical protein CVV07_13610 [Gammaproteobacteria bacterium HGW-Gammaproteobacteria-11]